MRIIDNLTKIISILAILGRIILCFFGVVGGDFGFYSTVITITICISCWYIGEEILERGYEKKKRDFELFKIIAIALVVVIIASIRYVPSILYSQRFEAYFLTIFQEKNASLEFYSSGDKMFTYIFDDDGYLFTSDYVPSERIASRPEDARVVVFIEKQKQLVGSYTDGGDAYRQVYDVKLIILNTWKTVVQKSFTGGKPPESKSAGKSKSACGDAPKEKDIIEWIEKEIDKGTFSWFIE